MLLMKVNIYQEENFNYTNMIKIKKTGLLSGKNLKPIAVD